MTTKNRRIKILGIKIISLPFIFIAVHYCFNYERIQADGIVPEIYVFCGEEGTTYSADYSHRGFNKIEIGMTKREVLEYVGEPLHKYSINKDTWTTDTLSKYIEFRYSIPSDGGNFRLRLVYFTGDTVTKIIKQFYFD